MSSPSTSLASLLIVNYDAGMAIRSTWNSDDSGLSDEEKEKYTQEEIRQHIKDNIQYPNLWHCILQKQLANGGEVGICAVHDAKTGAAFIRHCLELSIPNIDQKTLDKIHFITRNPDSEEIDNFGENKFILEFIDRYNEKHPKTRIDVKNADSIKRVTFVNSNEYTVVMAKRDLQCETIFVRDAISAHKSKIEANANTWKFLTEIQLENVENLVKDLIRNLGYSEAHAEAQKKIRKQMVSIREEIHAQSKILQLSQEVIRRIFEKINEFSKSAKESDFKKIKETIYTMIFDDVVKPDMPETISNQISELIENLCIKFESFFKLSLKNKADLKYFADLEKKAKGMIQSIIDRHELKEPTDHFDQLIKTVGLTTAELIELHNKIKSTHPAEARLVHELAQRSAKREPEFETRAKIFVGDDCKDCKELKESVKQPISKENAQSFTSIKARRTKNECEDDALSLKYSGISKQLSEMEELLKNSRKSVFGEFAEVESTPVKPVSFVYTSSPSKSPLARDVSSATSQALSLG